MRNTSFNRRQVLGGLSIGMLGAATGSTLLNPAAAFAQSGTPEVTDLELISVRDPQHSAQIAIATELGLFRAEGVNVSVNYTVNGPDVPSLAASGKIKLISTALDQVASLHEKGLDFRWLMKVSDISNTQGVVIGNNSGINAPADLAGKRIGMYSGAAVELAILNMCKAYDIDFSSLKFLNIEPPEQALALSRGDIDVMACWEPYVSNAASFGGRVYFTGNKSYIDDPDNPTPVNWLQLSTGLTTTPEFIQQAPNTLRAVMRAILKANDMIAANVDEVVAPISRNLGIPAEGLAAILRKNDYSPVIDERIMEGYPVYQDWAISRGYLQTGAAVKDMLDLSLLRDINPSAVKI